MLTLLALIVVPFSDELLLILLDNNAKSKIERPASPKREK